MCSQSCTMRNEECIYEYRILMQISPWSRSLKVKATVIAVSEKQRRAKWRKQNERSLDVWITLGDNPGGLRYQQSWISPNSQSHNRSNITRIITRSISWIPDAEEFKVFLKGKKMKDLCKITPTKLQHIDGIKVLKTNQEPLRLIIYK